MGVDQVSWGIRTISPVLGVALVLGLWALGGVGGCGDDECQQCGQCDQCDAGAECGECDAALQCDESTGCEDGVDCSTCALYPDVTCPPSEHIVYDGSGGWIVTGAEDVDLDAENVQWAIDHLDPGRRVLLRGTFHFANADEDENLITEWTDDGLPTASDRTVYLDNPDGVIIEGEWDSALDMPATTVIGGYAPFTAGRRAEHPLATPEEYPDDYYCRNGMPYGVDALGTSYYPDYAPEDFFIQNTVTIRNIRFLNPFYAAIDIPATSGVTIQSCRFEDGRRASYACALGGIHPEGYSISVISYNFTASLFGTSMEDAPWDVVSGTIEITDNTFIGNNRDGAVQKGSDDCPDGTHEELVTTGFDEEDDPITATYCVEDWAQYWDYSGMNVDPPLVNWIWAGYKAGVYLSTISMWTSADFIIARNHFEGADAAVVGHGNGGTRLVKDNTIELQFVDPFNSQVVQAVRFAEDYWGLPYMPFGANQAMVIGNTIEGVGGFDTEPRIWFSGQAEGIILQNTIETTGGVPAIGISAHEENCLIADNTIRGDGPFGIMVSGQGNGHSVRANDLTEFTGTYAQLAVQQTFTDWYELDCVDLDGETGECQEWEPCPEGYEHDLDPRWPDWCGRDPGSLGHCTIEDNLFGPLDETGDSATAALVLNATDSFAKDNDFTGTDLVGFETEIVDDNAVITSPGAIFLGNGSSDSFIYQSDGFPGTSTLCDQVLDWGTDNVVYGWADLCLE